MENDALQLFENREFGNVRVRMDEEGRPWFVAKDVCMALGIANHKDAISVLDDDEKSGVGISDPHGREQETLVISESGLYALILRSRKPLAKKFRRWVTDEVLPTIRKTGSYGVSSGQPALAEYEEKIAGLEAGYRAGLKAVGDMGREIASLHEESASLREQLRQALEERDTARRILTVAGEPYGGKNFIDCMYGQEEYLPVTRKILCVDKKQFVVEQYAIFLSRLFSRKICRTIEYKKELLLFSPEILEYTKKFVAAEKDPRRMSMDAISRFLNA